MSTWAIVVDLPTWKIIAPVIAALLVAGAAITAAIIAARTANARQAEQLEHDRLRFEAQIAVERERFDTQIAEERLRLDQQLEHDRQNRIDDELRATVDEAAVHVVAVMQASARLDAAADTFAEASNSLHEAEGEELGAATRQAKSAHTRLIDIRAELAQADKLLTVDRQRLEIRLGRDHAVVDAHRTVDEALTLYADLADNDEILPRGRSTEQVERVDRAANVADDALEQFFNACRELLT